MLAVNFKNIFSLFFHKRSAIFVFGQGTKSSSRDTHLKIKYVQIFKSIECNLHHVLFERQEILDRFCISSRFWVCFFLFILGHMVSDCPHSTEV